MYILVATIALLIGTVIGQRYTRHNYKRLINQQNTNLRAAGVLMKQADVVLKAANKEIKKLKKHLPKSESKSEDDLQDIIDKVKDEIHGSVF